MTDRASDPGKGRAPNHRRLALILVGLPLAMLGLSFAAVPLYRIFCQTTGYGGTTQRAEAPSGKVLDRMVTVRFDANVSSELGWSFRPVQREIKIKIGENAFAFYEAKNLTDKTLTGSASFNVTPEDAGAYFDKIQCFCFSEQTLKAGQTVQMPVSFFIDPAIEDDPNAKRIEEIVLSYTFFKVNKPDSATKPQSAAGAASKSFENAVPPG